LKKSKLDIRLSIVNSPRDDWWCGVCSNWTESLKDGNQVLKEIHSQMSIDEIENLMLDTQEAIAYQRK